MKKLILILIFFPAPLIAEPIELTCKGLWGNKWSYTIDIEHNTVKYADWEPFEIYHIDEDYIVWVLDKTLLNMTETYALERKTGILKQSYFNYDKDEKNIAVSFKKFQCLKSL